MHTGLNEVQCLLLSGHLPSYADIRCGYVLRVQS